MSSQPHLNMLERRHARTQDEIAKELSHPAHDDLRVSELKRRKLALKDEIVVLGG